MTNKIPSALEGSNSKYNHRISPRCNFIENNSTSSERSLSLFHTHTQTEREREREEELRFMKNRVQFPLAGKQEFKDKIASSANFPDLSKY
jgi:hypothetical protein